MQSQGVGTPLDQEKLLLGQAGFVVGASDSVADPPRVRLGTAFAFKAITTRWGRTVASFATVDDPQVSTQSRMMASLAVMRGTSSTTTINQGDAPRHIRCVVTARAGSAQVNGSALDALWRFAGGPPTDSSTTDAVEALGSYALCGCGRHVDDGHRYQASANPLCSVREGSVEVLHHWACRARLLVAFAAHLRLCRRGGSGRAWQAPIPCMGRMWTIEEAIIGVQGPGDNGGVAGPDNGQASDTNGDGITQEPLNAARHYLEELGQWVALQASVQAWLSATRPQMALVTAPPPTASMTSGKGAARQARDRAAGAMSLDAALSGNSDAICVAGLELVSILADVDEGRACFKCGQPVHLQKRGWAKRPCCDDAPCKRERDRLQRQESQVKRSGRQPPSDALT